jgi:uncharacterized protein (DUF2345 family)
MPRTRSAGLRHKVDQTGGDQRQVELQAQNDGLDAIARKGIQITSTEDSVYITAQRNRTGQ